MHASVVDVYSGWCGPCKAVLGLLRRLKNEIGKSGLLFAAVSLLFAVGALPCSASLHSWHVRMMLLDTCLPPVLLCAYAGKD